jgi:hypothetical protein
MDGVVLVVQGAAPVMRPPARPEPVIAAVHGVDEGDLPGRLDFGERAPRDAEPHMPQLPPRQPATERGVRLAVDLRDRDPGALAALVDGANQDRQPVRLRDPGQRVQQLLVADQPGHGGPLTPTVAVDTGLVAGGLRRVSHEPGPVRTSQRRHQVGGLVVGPCDRVAGPRRQVTLQPAGHQLAQLGQAGGLPPQLPVRAHPAPPGEHQAAAG